MMSKKDKFLLFLCIGLLFLISTSGCKKNKTESSSDIESSKPPAEPAKIEFEETVYNFGEITAGDTIRHTFRFKNIGNVPLVIAGAEAQCGCTVPEWPREPISPGDTGEIKVVFNSAHKIDKQDKKVSVIANTNPDITVISLQGFVKPAPEDIH